MDNRQLQIFHSVVKLGSFTKAAQSLHIAQPAVSIAIQKLERELEVVLLNRADKKVGLTSEGARLFAHAEKILQQFEQAIQEVQELNCLQGGQVRLATPAMLGSYYFPEKIAEFRALYPDIDIQISGEGTQRAQQMILNGDIDMAVITMEDLPESLEAHRLVKKEEVVACVWPGHPFAGRKDLSFGEFAEESLIVYREGYYLRELIGKLSREIGVEPRMAVETNLLRLMISQVQQQQGIGFCLRRVVEAESKVVGISFSEPLYLDMAIAWKRNHYLSKANRRFVEYLLEESEGGL